MPDVDGRTSNRLTRSLLDEAQGDQEGCAGQALCDITAELARVEVVRALSLGRSPDTIDESNRVRCFWRGVRRLWRGARRGVLDMWICRHTCGRQSVATGGVLEVGTTGHNDQRRRYRYHEGQKLLGYQLIFPFFDFPGEPLECAPRPMVAMANATPIGTSIRPNR